jgi:hypothetical protein
MPVPIRAVAGAFFLLAVLALVTASGVGAAQRGRTLIDIHSKERPLSGEGRFFFSLGTGGDLGKLRLSTCCMHDRRSPDGFTYTQYGQTTSFLGRSGTLMIRSTGRAYDAPGKGTEYVWEGTWSILRGKSTGDYATMTGGGRWIGIATHVDHSVTSEYSGYIRR